MPVLEIHDEDEISRRKISLYFLRELPIRARDARTVYLFYTIDVDRKPKAHFKCLKRLVGERGFEPPSAWSRNQISVLVEICRISLFAND